MTYIYDSYRQHDNMNNIKLIAISTIALLIIGVISFLSIQLFYQVRRNNYLSNENILYKTTIQTIEKMYKEKQSSIIALTKELNKERQNQKKLSLQRAEGANGFLLENDTLEKKQMLINNIL